MGSKAMIHAAIKQSLKVNKEKEEEKAREKAHEAMKFNAEQAERAAKGFSAAQTMSNMAKATRVKPKSKKTYGKKNYTNAKGYPRKAQSYGDN
tara:strand:- start:71 stop:349 length:279 start_codon:yes stop_codon:yes gene_type:complete